MRRDKLPRAARARLRDQDVVRLVADKARYFVWLRFIGGAFNMVMDVSGLDGGQAAVVSLAVCVSIDRG
jgi:hypothetical protein